MGTEKRVAKRVPFTINVTYWVNEQERSHAYQVKSVNISEGGIFIKTDIPLGIGTEVMLEFSISGDSEKLRMQGKVVWSGDVHEEGKSSVAGKGIEFMECDDRCREKLQDYVSEKS